MKTTASRKNYALTAVDLRFGTATTPHIRRDVARLTAFPSAKDPILLMFGTLADRRSVVFYLMDRVTIRGSGSCVPRVSLCTQLILRPGQRVVLTDSSGKRYRLALNRVTVTKTTSAKLARRAYRRVSAAGQCVLDVVGAYGYDGAHGAAFRRSTGKGCRYTLKPKTLGARR